jgi:hypothetical protein
MQISTQKYNNLAYNNLAYNNLINIIFQKLCQFLYNDIYTFNKPIDVSDIFLYKNVDTYIYRYNYITVLNNDSTIHSEHLNWQKKYTEIQNNMIYK